MTPLEIKHLFNNFMKEKGLVEEYSDLFDPGFMFNEGMTLKEFTETERPEDWISSAFLWSPGNVSSWDIIDGQWRNHLEEAHRK